MSALDNVKHWMKANYAAACAAFSIPCEASSKEHECPLCGKRKFRVRMSSATAGTYICTCGVKGCGFGLLDLIARKELGASSGERVSGPLIRQAAMLVDERMGLGFFAADDSYTLPTAEEQATRERERKEALEQRQRESAEQEQQKIAEAASRVRGVLAKAKPAECAYLRAKDFENCILPVTARGDGVLRLTDIDNRDRSVQYLPAPDALDDDGNKRHKSLMSDAPISGAFIDIQPDSDANTLIITEGYATGRSVSICAPLSRVVAAIHAGNLQNVATAFRDRFPALEIVIAADNDYHAPSDVDVNGRPKQNTGLVKANEAAKAVEGLVVAPLCLGRKKQDWDDVRMEMGAERMKEEFNRELEKARKEKASGQEAILGTTQSNVADSNPFPRDGNASDATSCKSPDDEGAMDKQRIAIVPAGTNYSTGVSNDYEKFGPWRNTMQQEWASLKAWYICSHWLMSPEGKKQQAFILHEPQVRGKEDEKEVKDCNSTVLCTGIELAGRGWLENEACMTLKSESGHRFSFKASELNPKNLRVILSNMGGEPDQSTNGMEKLATVLGWKPCPAFTYSMLPGWHRLSDESGKERFNYTSLNGKTYGCGKETHSAMLTLPAETSAFPVTALKQWRDGVASLAVGNPIMVFTILYALAAPFYRMATEKTKAEMPIIHIFGTTTQGKTTALKGAASVLGKPDRAMYGWSATAYGLTQLATAMNNGLLILDELQLAGTGDSSEGSKLSKAFRELSEGAGKIQGKPIGYGFVRTPRFETAILSSGELSAESFIESKGGDTSGGVGARLLDIPFIPYEEFHGYDDSKEFVEAYESAAAKANGVALDAVLTELCEMDVTELRAAIKEQADAFNGWLRGVTSDPVVIRALSKLAPVYAIGLMTEHITGFTDDDINGTFTALVNSYAEHNGTGNRDERKFLEALHDAIVENRTNIQPRDIKDGAESRYISCTKGFFETKKISSGDDNNDTYPVWLLRPAFIKEVMPAMDYMKKINALRNAGRFEWHESVLNGDKPETESNITTVIKVRTGLKEGVTTARLISISGHDGFGA